MIPASLTADRSLEYFAYQCYHSQAASSFPLLSPLMEPQGSYHRGSTRRLGTEAEITPLLQGDVDVR